MATPEQRKRLIEMHRIGQRLVNQMGASMMKAASEGREPSAELVSMNHLCDGIDQLIYARTSGLTTDASHPFVLTLHKMVDVGMAFLVEEMLRCGGCTITQRDEYFTWKREMNELLDAELETLRTEGA